MEASLPISTTVEPVRPRKASAASPLSANAPSIKLPLAFMLTGLASLLIGVIWLVAQPSILASYHYNQSAIAATHLFALGWICSVIMGAMYQLVPVALETRLYSERLAQWQFAFHLVGFAGMVWMFRVWNMKQVGHFGSVMAVGVGLFVFNLAQTLRRVPKWNLTATAVTAALFWISVTLVAGLSIAAGKCDYESTSSLAKAAGVSSVLAGLRAVGGFMARFDQMSAMHAHAHLSGVGFFTLLIVGVSYKLIPMFTLSEIQNRSRAAASIGLLNLGLAGVFITILLRSPWKLAFALVILAALACYGAELRAILRARKRQTLDWGVKYFLTAVTLLIPLALLCVTLSWPGFPLNTFTGQLENLYGFLGLGGVVTLAILGMLYKIIPFLAWFGAYSRHVGRAQVPALADLYSTRLQTIGYWSFLTGLAVTSAAIPFSSATGVLLGSILLAVSVLAFTTNVGKILAHLACPQLTPLAPTKSAKGS